MIRWLRSRYELHAENRLLDRHAKAVGKKLRGEVAAHETTMRELDAARSRIAQLEAERPVDQGGEGVHRHCVPLSTHMQAINEIDRFRDRTTTPGSEQ